jgi:hypothetical protein
MTGRRRAARAVVAAIATCLLAGGPAAADTNHCEITVAGETTVGIKADAPRDAAQGKLTASTDYWLSDAQLHMAVETMQSLGKRLSPADKQRKLDEAMKKDPRFMLLLINCLSDDGGVILTASEASKYADVPMKPASYPIVPTDQVKAKAGELTAMFHLGGGAGKRETYVVTAPGKLTLTQFDRKAIAGTFTFKAEQRGKAPKHITVTGSFNYRCSGDACQK